MKKLILIRHGETDYTMQRRYCGHENVPLNTKGIAQVKRLRTKFKNMKIDKIYASDLKRAFQTAKIVFPEKRILKRRGFREIDFGQFSGLTFEEASKAYPDVCNAWFSNPQTAKIPGGEDFTDFAQRVKRCLDAISRQNHKKTVALVSHGGTIRVVILKVLQKSFDKFWETALDTAAVNIIEFKNG